MPESRARPIYSTISGNPIENTMSEPTKNSMSDTPRTDGMTGYFIDGSGIKKGDAIYIDPKGPFVLADFARELERELAEAKAENARLRDAGKALRDALAFECHKLGDCPREIDAWDAVAKAGYSL